MEQVLPNYNITAYTNEDSKSIETFSQILYGVIKEAISNNAVKTILEGMTSITDRYERISNLLNIQDIKNSKCFHFGYITALSSLCVDLAHTNFEDIYLQELCSSYPLLIPTLRVIAKYDTISGVKLKKETGQKPSSFSNFMRRIEPYCLINVSKVGTMNYYSLTNRGKSLLCLNNVAPPREDQVPINLVFLILDEIATQLKKDKASSIPVLHIINNNIPSFNKQQIMKYKLENVFLSRDSYVRKFVYSCATAVKEESDIEEYDEWVDNYLLPPKTDFSVLEEASYV